jgi:hypothetical protein
MKFKPFVFLAFFLVCGHLQAQDLEPRRWSHLPSDLNFIGVGLGYTYGDVFFNPVLKVEDATVDLSSVGAAYIRSFDWYGMSARFDASVPFTKGKWQGLLDGELAEARRQGFGDVRLRLSVNLLGAPALKGKEFAAFRASSRVHTTVGAAISVLVPSGEYTDKYLINLGQNRWVLRPQLGVLHERGKWQFEVTGSVFLFGRNHDFWQDSVLEQDPLWFIQGHLIHTFRPGLWASFSTGFGHGGRSRIDGDPASDDSRVSYWAISLGFPVTSRHGFNLAYAASETNTITGSKLDGFRLGWSMMFGD